MYKFNDYREDCKLANKVEDAVNVCGSDNSHLERVKSLFDNDNEMFQFMLACVHFWSESEYWDGRNEYAVLLSKEIAKHFQYGLVSNDKELNMNAYGFTQCGHRYLQNELFKAFILDCKQQNNEIHKFLEEKDFVILNNKAIPYGEYKRTLGW